MTESIFLMAAILAVLQIKHGLCDYVLQNSYQLLNKGIYLHPGGLMHAGSHALLTTATFLIVPPALALGVGIVVVEFLVHYHVDWAKEQLVRRTGWTPVRPSFWWAVGFDQLLHQLTYIAIATLLVSTV